jgi:hypothetical protein
MAIQVNWVTGEIYVPKADTTLLTSTPYEIRQLDTDAFRKELRDLEDDVEGRWVSERTHEHNTEVTIGGVTFARQVIILPPYTVTFENGNWGVILVGSNNNIFDVNNKNTVSVYPTNSAGLISNYTLDEIWGHADASRRQLINSLNPNVNL